MTVAYDVGKLQAARLWVTARQPYLAMALHSMDVRIAPGYGTFGVDPSWRVYVDPAVLAGWEVEQVGAVLVHEVWHLLREHARRSVAAPDRPAAWNLACDAEINDDLLAAGLPLPGTPVTPGLLGMPDGLLAEDYLTAVPPAALDFPDCGSGADGVPRPHEQGLEGGPPPMTAAQADLVRAATAREVAEAAHVGDVPAGWARWAQGMLHPQVDWRVVLAASVRRGLAVAAGRSDYTMSRPSRRSAAVPGVVLPSLRRPVPQIAVVVDTSASVDDEMLAQALAEVDGALQAGGVHRDAVTVLTCDTQVGPAQRVRAAAQVRLAGGGGTDLRVGIEAAGALRPRRDVLVVLTDGATPWPVAPPPRMRVVVALLERDAPAPPAWATVVRAYAGPGRGTAPGHPG